MKAFQSLGDGHLPAATSTTAAASSPRFSSTRADRELKEHEEVSKDTSTMDTSNNTKLSTIYYQTRNTRRARNTTTLHNIDNSTMQQIHNTHIGSFDTEHKINSNFLASRNDSTKHMHQNIALSFDPKDMQCTSCTNTHNITHPAPDTPVTYVLSDQNFPGNCGGGGAVHPDDTG